MQQFKHRGDAGASKAVSKGSRVFAVGGAVFGFAIGYMVSSGSILWMIAGLVLGGIFGYLLGKKVDAGKQEGL